MQRAGDAVVAVALGLHYAIDRNVTLEGALSDAVAGTAVPSTPTDDSDLPRGD